MSSHQLSRLGRHATVYARHGINVFPCQPGGKQPATRNGFKDATTDPDQVAAWWTATPDANIGAPTGVTFDVVDLDYRVRSDGTAEKNADPTLQLLRDGGFLHGSIGEATTRHGGVHYFYPASGLRSGSIPTACLDYKAAGGYVLLAPSIVPADDGILGPGVYTWDRVLNFNVPGRPFLWDAVKALLQPPPPRVESRFTTPTGSSSSIEHLTRWVAEQPEGNRNHGLFWAACTAIKDGHDPTQLADPAIASGLDPVEVARTIDSARRKQGASS